MKITRNKTIIFAILILALFLIFIFYPRKLSNLILTREITANESDIWRGGVS